MSFEMLALGNETQAVLFHSGSDGSLGRQPDDYLP